MTPKPFRSEKKRNRLMQMCAIAITANLAINFLYSLQSASAQPDINRKEGDTPISRGKESFKGWELYSWNENGQWFYSLLIGTNRIKTCDEVKNPDAKKNLAQILDEIRKLAPEQYLGWSINMGAAPKDCNLAYPPKGEVEQIRALCKERHIQETDELK